jgi:GT2 family glycosyltransferase
MDASVIIPTRNRPESLKRCLSALGMQNTRREFEVIVVDDANPAQLQPDDLAGCPRARVVRSDGVGPGMARNRGVADATSPLILFTDDDTAPSPDWVEAACSYLVDQAQSVGVEGPIVSPPYDPLYERSVHTDGPGAYWTCNIAYRREALIRLGGFADVFPWAHAEDQDLGYRACQLGPIGFADEMVVTHYPSGVTLAQDLKRARYAASDLVLYRRHPERFASRVPFVLLPTVTRLRVMKNRLRDERSAMIGTPRRLTRFTATIVGVTVVALWHCCFASNREHTSTGGRRLSIRAN